MHSIIWIDDNGYKHLSTVIDGESNPENGIQTSPPDVNMIDWSALGIPYTDELVILKKDLHNQLVERGLFTWLDVQVKGGLLSVLTSTIKKHNFDISINALKRQIIVLYKLEEKATEDY